MGREKKRRVAAANAKRQRRARAVGNPPFTLFAMGVIAYETTVQFLKEELSPEPRKT